MRFDVITLFPELFEPFLKAGVTRRAYETRQVDVRLWNPRDFAEGNYRRVDDRPFGGGPGMVMLAEPLEKCLQAIRTDRAEAEPAAFVLFSPIGQTLNHTAVQGWSESRGAILLCGRYEGVDQRFIDRHVTHQISLGDFVLSGGEIAALALLARPMRLLSIRAPQAWRDWLAAQRQAAQDERMWACAQRDPRLMADIVCAIQRGE